MDDFKTSQEVSCETLQEQAAAKEKERRVLLSELICDYRSHWLDKEQSILALDLAVRMKMATDDSGLRAKLSLGLGVRELDGFVVVTSFKFDDSNYRLAPIYWRSCQ